MAGVGFKKLMKGFGNMREIWNAIFDRQGGIQSCVVMATIDRDKIVVVARDVTARLFAFMNKYSIDFT